MMPGRRWGPVFRLLQTTRHFRLEAVDSLCAHRGDGKIAHERWQKGRLFDRMIPNHLDTRFGHAGETEGS